MSEGFSVSKRDAAINLLVMAAVLGGLYFLIQHFGLDDIRAYVDRAGVWAPIVLVIAKAATIVIAPLGGGPLYPLAGAIFGFWESFFLLMLGDIVGGVISFALGRLFGQKILRYFFVDQVGVVYRMLDLFTTLRGLVLARLTLIALPELFVYAAGVSSARFWPFFFVYTILNAPPTAFMTSLGTLLSLSYGPFLVPLILGGVSAVAFLSFPMFYKMHMPEKEESPTTQSSDSFS